MFDRIAGRKYFNVYGPHEGHKGDMRSMVSNAYEQIRELGKIELFQSYRADYADGERMRYFIAVREYVTTYLAMDDRNK